MQWIFIQLFKERDWLTRKRKSGQLVSSCQTVLANEQVVDGVYERACKIVTKNLSQWYFKITDYADRLLENLDNGKLDGWPARSERAENWIGKSYGCEVDFKMKDSDETLTVFTTRVDTIYGTTLWFWHRSIRPF